MKRKAFDELLRSVREAGRVRRGQSKPSRAFELRPGSAKAIRRRLKPGQRVSRG